MPRKTMFRTGLVAAGALAVMLLAGGAAQAASDGNERPNPGMQRMHQLMQHGNPGMQQMMQGEGSIRMGSATQ